MHPSRDGQFHFFLPPLLIPLCNPQKHLLTSRTIFFSLSPPFFLSPLDFVLSVSRLLSNVLLRVLSVGFHCALSHVMAIVLDIYDRPRSLARPSPRPFMPPSFFFLHRATTAPVIRALPYTFLSLSLVSSPSPSPMAGKGWPLCAMANGCTINASFGHHFSTSSLTACLPVCLPLPPSPSPSLRCPPPLSRRHCLCRRAMLQLARRPEKRRQKRGRCPSPPPL